jgi:hypothetical protein
MKINRKLTNGTAKPPSLAIRVNLKNWADVVLGEIWKIGR